MINYNNIISKFNTIATNHLQINSFQNGTLDEVSINKLSQTDYVFLYVELENVVIDNGVMQYVVNVLVCDLLQGDNANRNDVYSNTLQILNDVIAEFIQSASSTSSVGSETIIQLPISCEPFTARFENELTGFNATLNIEVNDKNNLCIAPIT